MANGQARMFRASLIPLGPLPRNSVGCGCRYQITSGDSSILLKRGVTRSPILFNGDKRPKLNTLQHHLCERNGKGARYQVHEAESLRATRSRGCVLQIFSAYGSMISWVLRCAAYPTLVTALSALPINIIFKETLYIPRKHNISTEFSSGSIRNDEFYLLRARRLGL
jgi:hypothetical protein